MPSIADAAAEVMRAGVPLLFLDTCTILDAIRAPVRGLIGCVEAANRLHALATATPAQCSLVVGSFVPTEWADHDQEVLKTINTHLDRMQEQADHLHSLCGHLSLPISGLPQYQATGIASRLHDISRLLLGSAAVLDRHPEAMSRAFERVTVTKRRPCKKGGELKDCTIFEEYLELCRHLQAGGFSHRVVFCTSNINDYCDPNATPHADVAEDCDSVGMVFTTSLPWALSALTT